MSVGQRTGHKGLGSPSCKRVNIGQGDGELRKVGEMLVLGCHAPVWHSRI